MKGLYILYFLLGWFMFADCCASVKEKTDSARDLEIITDRLVSSYLDEKVDDNIVSKLLDEMLPDGSFANVNYEQVKEMANFPVITHLENLKLMSIAYHTQKSKFFHSKVLLKQIVFGIEYWYKKQPKSPNWWYNDIGTPRVYMVVLILLKGEIDNDLLYRYSSYLRDLTSNKAHRGKNRNWVSDVTIHKGCIEDNIDLLKIGFKSIASTITVVSKQGEEGIKIDGSFHQHRPQLYSGGYGLSYAEDIAYYLNLASGTSFEYYFSGNKLKIYSNLLLNGHRWLGYRNTFDFGAVGRNISRKDVIQNISFRTLELMETLDPCHSDEYLNWKKHLFGASSSILGNKYFWKSDIMVQRGENYYLSAKVISKRTNGTEMLNAENLKGYNLPLGATNILVSGKEYKNIFSVWDWRKIPGTTAVQNPDSTKLEGYLFGKNDFAGGVSSGRNGLLSYKHEYRGVKAQKSYFFINDVLVCLGAGISSDAKDEVHTTVNQCLFANEVVVGKNSEVSDISKYVQVDNPQWVYHNNVGYLFPKQSNVLFSVKQQTGTWNDINNVGSKQKEVADIFCLEINHGKQPLNETYAYMVVPNCSRQKFTQFVKKHDIDIIKNTTKVQAVKDKNCYAVVFYEPDTIRLSPDVLLSSDQSVLVYVEKNTDGSFDMWVADPLYEQRNVFLTLNNREVKIDLPEGDFVGDTKHIHIPLIQPYDLRCEYLKNPMGMDMEQPRLSWKMGTLSFSRGQKQTAFQVLVSSSLEKLNVNNGDLWDSGCVESENTTNIIYSGKRLHSVQKCYWKIRLKNEEGIWSSWSESASWRMGLFADDQRAKWISSSDLEKISNNGERIDNKMYDPWLRKSFTLNETPKDAVVYVASIGYHELYINGKKVGDAILAPSVSDHKSRARYVTYDITNYLSEGDNVMAVWLGTSWSIFPAYQRNDKPAIPMLFLQAEFLSSTNEKMTLISDSTWKVHSSPNKLLGYWEAHHFGGEFYDASLEIEGWNKIGFDDTDWMNAKEYVVDMPITSDRAYPNRPVKRIHPVSIQEVSSGVYKVDMGVNYTGWFELELEGMPGDSVVFHFSEKQQDSCSYGIHSIYKVGPRKKGVFCNRFNYMTGRWVQISGLRQKPRLDQIKGWMIRTDYERCGFFKSDVPLLNDIYDTALWTFENLSLGNYVVDCPHRERCGYGGDALATTRMGLGNYDLGAFYTKWMEDWRDVQEKDGNLPYTAPTRIGGGGPSWSGFCIILPWEMYCQYGDVRILKESYSTMKNWLNYLEKHAKDDMLVRWGGKWSFLGDWLWPDAWTERSFMEKQGKALGDTRETLFFNNCFWVYSLQIVARIADILGNEEDAIIYSNRAKQVSKAVHGTFYNKETKDYVNAFPAYTAIALMVNLSGDDKLNSQICEQLLYVMRDKYKGHFWGGITAGSFLMHFLMDKAFDSLIYEMVSKEDFPSWGYMLRKGNTTFMEDWESRGSALHSSYLYVGSWFIENLGGIRRPNNDSRRFVISPWIAKQGPHTVNATYRSLFGTFSIDWRIKDNMVLMTVIVPPNTTAELQIPKSCLKTTLKESGMSWKESDGITVKKSDTHDFSLILQSGHYSFSASLNPEKL